MSPELEAMARAMFDENHKRTGVMEPHEWLETSSAIRGLWRGFARAALLAIREPTEAMVFAALDMADTLGPLGPTATWQALIDHILGAER